MRQLYATLRHRPAPLVGVLVALTMTSVFLTWALSLAGAGNAAKLHARRLAATAVAVTGNRSVTASAQGPADGGDPTPLSGYRRIPSSLISMLTAVPGAAHVVADQSVPVALELPGGRIAAGAPLTGHGWQSAVLTPFHLRVGHAPTGPDQIVVADGVAAADHLSVGDRVGLAGRSGAPFTVVGVADAPAGGRAGDGTVFFSPAQADALYGHPGQVDLIGVVAGPGISPAALAARVRAALSGRPQLSVVIGSGLATAEDPGVTDELSNVTALADTAGIIDLYVSVFVAASTVALSVAERRRTWALLVAVGATPGQVRRTVLGQLAVLGVLAGPAGYLPGVWLASLTARGLAVHRLLPAGAHPWTSPIEILPATAVAVVVAQIAGFLTAYRTSRTHAVAALGESAVERRRASPLRLVLGLAALVTGIVLAVQAFTEPDPAQPVSQAEYVMVPFMAAIAFLGPYLVGLAERALRRPLHALGPAAGRLAAAELRFRSGRMSAAAVAVALPVAYAGAIIVVNAGAAHASAAQARQRLTADAVVSAPGPGLDRSVLSAIGRQSGTGTVIGLAPTTVYLPHGATAENSGAEAVTPGSLTSVLDLAVTSGSLRSFGPGDIALSRLAVDSGAASGVGQTITTHLADGTPYRAKVTAVYTRSLGFADALIPSDAAGGGHLGTSTFSQVLVGVSAGASPSALVDRIASLRADYPGLQVAGRSVANAQHAQQASQSSYTDGLLLSLIALLAGVALVNTLVMATVQRREEFTVLARIGATMRQLVVAVAWQAAAVTLVGVILGAAAQVATVTAISEALTGSLPYVPWRTVLLVAGFVGLLAGLAMLAPTMLMVRRRKNE